MKKSVWDWKVVLGIVLVLLSAIAYFIHYLLFHDAHHIFIYLIGDIAFVPMEVLLVTLVIHRVLSIREKRSMMEKLNMVIGAFFSEVGNELLKRFADLDTDADYLEKDFLINPSWTDKEFTAASVRLAAYDYKIDCIKCDWPKLREFLMDKKGFLLNLLANPNLLEHESFTELLWAVFHLMEELTARADIADLPATDYEHLAGDIKRSYGILLSEWLSYMKHLKGNYPFLFSLAVRTNPLNSNREAIVM